MEFELIQYSSVSAEEALYEVFTDIICLRDYDITEIENILRGFGYESVEDVVMAYRNIDEANQVIAECIFEHLGSHSVEPMCRGVSEDMAEKAIFYYITSRWEYPPNHWKVEISVEELVKKALALDTEATLEFETQKTGHAYGIKWITPFDTDVLLLNYYQGGSPYVVELVADENSTLEVSVLNRFKQYCDGENIEAIIISTEPKDKPLCEEAQKIRDRKRDALLSKEALMTIPTPRIVQAVVGENYTIYAYIKRWPMRLMDVLALIDNSGVFASMHDLGAFKRCLTVMNDTVAWDLIGRHDLGDCIDLDPFSIQAKEKPWPIR